MTALSSYDATSKAYRAHKYRRLNEERRAIEAVSALWLEWGNSAEFEWQEGEDDSHASFAKLAMHGKTSGLGVDGSWVAGIIAPDMGPRISAPVILVNPARPASPLGLSSESAKKRQQTIAAKLAWKRDWAARQEARAAEKKAEDALWESRRLEMLEAEAAEAAKRDRETAGVLAKFEPFAAIARASPAVSAVTILAEPNYYALRVQLINGVAFESVLLRPSPPIDISKGADPEGVWERHMNAAIDSTGCR